MRRIRNLAFASVSILSLATPAFAQNLPADEADSDEEIVVTGTLIRGIAPGGSQSIGVSQEKIEAVGAANTSDLIASVPQAGNYLTFVGVRGSNNFSLTVNRPSLRYLGNISGATASTLLLVDGHRLPGMGVIQNSADLDSIPASAIERVEIVTDGGSATYGSDAVGGVMNFITRKSFDGVEAKAGYGFGDNYQQANASIIAGKAWDWGSTYVAYDYSWHDSLYGKDRDWSQSLDWVKTAAAGSPVGSSPNCIPGNLLFGATRLPLTSTGAVGAGSANQCDITELWTFYPREVKHSALASLVIDSGGPVSFSLKAFYVNRKIESDGGPLTQDVTIRSSSPFFVIPAGLTPVPCPSPNQAFSCETVNANYGAVIGNNTPQTTTLESFGITPSMKIDLGGDWQVNAMFNYGRSDNFFIGNLFNATPVVTAATAGTFDPFHLGASGNAAAILSARDWFQYGRATQSLTNNRVVVDGPLAKLPGGDLRVAIGAEYMREDYSGVTNRNATAATIASLADINVGRNVKSVFGEINLPIVGADNRGFIYGLSLTASGRYDDYSDFGGTFNPKFGVNFQPVEWLKLRGTWGKAYQAPGLADLAQAGLPTMNVLPTSLRPFFDPITPKGPNGTHQTYILALGGSFPGLAPQKATTWSLGFDMKPPVVPGLEFGMTYYNIDFKGIIGIGPINQPYFYALYGDRQVLYTKGNQAMIEYFNSLTSAISSTAKQSALDQFSSNWDAVYSVLDGRTGNNSSLKTSGLDFYLRYNRETHFGDVYLDFAGTYILTFKNGGTTGLLDTNGIEPNNRLKLGTTVGTDIGNLRAQVTWQHTDGYGVTSSVENLGQTRVGGMDVFNLFFRYKVPGESALLKDLVFTLNVDNVFDVDPPLFRARQNSLFGVGNGFTLGRVVKIGISKKF